MNSTDSRVYNDTVLEDVLPIMPKNVGHLLEEPLQIDCPACGCEKVTTRVEQEAVTCLQKAIAVINICLCCNPIRWKGRHDINHYCGRCGCFIGRCITLSWYKRQLFRMQRNDIDAENRWQRFANIEKETLDRNRHKSSEFNGIDGGNGAE